MTRIQNQALTVTVAEAARMLRISRNAAYQACHTGQLRAIRIGKRWLVPRTALERLLTGEGQDRGGEK